MMEKAKPGPIAHDTRKDFRRKNIRLPAKDYRGQRLYFVTLCFDQRRRFGANARVAAWIIERLASEAAAHGFLIHAYCVMPDHMHIFCAGERDESDLRVFIEGFKRESGFAFSRRTSERLWQFKYYDRVMRQTDPADGVAWYIWLNPVRKRLCRAPTEYAFAGSFTAVGKKMLNSAARADWIPPWKKVMGRVSR